MAPFEKRQMQTASTSERLGVETDWASYQHGSLAWIISCQAMLLSECASDKLGPSRFALGVWPYLWIGGGAGIRPVSGLRNGEYGRVMRYRDGAMFRETLSERGSRGRKIESLAENCSFNQQTRTVGEIKRAGFVTASDAKAQGGGCCIPTASGWGQKRSSTVRASLQVHPDNTYENTIIRFIVFKFQIELGEALDVWDVSPDGLRPPSNVLVCRQLGSRHCGSGVLVGRGAGSALAKQAVLPWGRRKVAGNRDLSREPSDADRLVL
ncbi:hypothetical protein VTN00DRAFT_1315 [Thermoascus crustaceus]|uniref:uncharacterized protein n=1 Tax=Thermoascus crustaceus TaxID=5088 RepID=UPI0037432806